MSDSTSSKGGPVALVRRGVRLLPADLHRRVRRAVALSVLLAVLEAASFACLFLLIQLIAGSSETPDIVTDVLGAANDQNALITRLGGVTLLLLLCRSAGNLVLLRVQAGLQASTDAALAKRLFASVMAAPYSVLVQRNSAESVATVAYRVPEVAANSVGVVVAVSADVAVLVGVIGTLVLVTPILAASVVVYFAVVAAGLIKILTPAIRASSFLESAEASAAQQSLQEGVGGVKGIKANEMTAFFSERFNDRRESLRVVRERRVFLGKLPSFYLETSLFVGLALLAVVVFRSGEEDIVATFGVLVAASLRTLPSVNRLVGAVAGIRASEASLDAVEEELGRAAEDVPTTSSGDARRLTMSEHLRLDDVSYTYAGASAPALSHVTIDIAAGEAVGLVGGSGAGKTTLVDIVLGLLSPSGGRLLVDDTEVLGEQVAAWRHAIGYVPQDVYLLDGTLRENIVFGRPTPSEDALAAAVEFAQLSELVTALPKGLEARVGERGGRMSGGQRQRIGIARALLREPSLLILDEATSALDNKTEAAVTAAIAGLKGRVTTIVIAHRLSTVKPCDRIILLDGGRCVGEGAFDELRRENPAFADLVRLGQLDSGPGKPR